MGTKTVKGIYIDSWRPCSGMGMVADCVRSEYCINGKVHITYTEHYDNKIDGVEYNLCPGHPVPEPTVLPKKLFPGYKKFLKANKLRPIDELIANLDKDKS